MTYQELYDRNLGIFMKYPAAAKDAIGVYSNRGAKKKYGPEDFNELPPSWETLTTTSVILIGPPGIGKTQWAKTWFQNPLLVRHIDTLHRFQEGTHDGIIFDDMDFRHWSRTAQIGLVDQEEGSQVHCRYYVGYIPAGLPKVFTGNEDPFDLVDGAIARRTTTLRYDNKLFE